MTLRHVLLLFLLIIAFCLTFLFVFSPDLFLDLFFDIYGFGHDSFIGGVLSSFTYILMFWACFYISDHISRKHRSEFINNILERVEHRCMVIHHSLERYPYYMAIYHFVEKVDDVLVSMLHRFFKATISIDSEKTKERLVDQQLYEDVVQRFSFHVPKGDELTARIFGSVEAFHRLPKSVQQAMDEVTTELYLPDFTFTIPPPPDPSNEAELQQWRAILTHWLSGYVLPDPNVCIRVLAECFEDIKSYLPDPRDDSGLNVSLRCLVSDQIVWLILGLSNPFFVKDVIEQNLFATVRLWINKNTPLDKHGLHISPTKYKGDEDIVIHYLSGTPLYKLVFAKVPVPIPEKLRFEHTHMLASSGGGKTTTMKHFLMRDFEKVAQGKASVIVVDSQSKLIDEITHLSMLKDRFVIVDPRDVEHPVALSLFSTSKEGTPADIERAENSLIQLLSHVFMPEMTPKQCILLEAVLRLMFRIPDATIETLYHFLQPNGYDTYQQYITALPPMSQAFFHNEYRNDKQFRETKEQLVWRLWAVLNNNTFRNMFINAHSKLDLSVEMQAGKVILINTDKDMLSDAGTELLGRYFIALIAQAAQRRVNLPDDKMTPCFVYIDEFAEYTKTASNFIRTVFTQARKFKVGMFVAHHSLGDLPAETQNAIVTNTSIKFVRAINHDDTVKMAKEMETTPEFIKAQGNGFFAVFLRDGKMKTALSVAMPIGAMEAAPRMSPDEYDVMRQTNRDRYCTTQQPPPKEAAVTTFEKGASAPTIPQPTAVDDAPFVPSSAPPKTKKKPKKIDPDQTNIEPADW